MVFKVPSNTNHSGIREHQCGLLFSKNNMPEEETPLPESLSQWEICPACSDVEGKVLHCSSQAHQWQFQNRQGWFAYVHIYSLAESYKYSKSQSISTKMLLFPNRPAESKHCCLMRQNNSLDSLGSIWSIWSNAYLRSHLGYIFESSHNTLKLGSYHKNRIWIIYSLSPSFSPFFFSLPGRWTQTLGCKGWLFTDCTTKLQEKHIVFNYLTVKTYGNNLWDSYYFHFLSWTTLLW